MARTFATCSGTETFQINDANGNPKTVSVFYYRASYSGGSETTVSVENAIYAIVIRTDYRNRFALTFETGGTIAGDFKSRNDAINYAISFLLATVCK